MGRLVVLDALFHPSKYHKTPQLAVDWWETFCDLLNLTMIAHMVLGADMTYCLRWIAGAAFFGGSCFMVGGFSGSSQVRLRTL